MKTKNYKVLGLITVTAALAAGCQVRVAGPDVYVPPPPEVTVTVGVPDSYVWDGYEYVGFVGGGYVYLGPGGRWVGLEPYRMERFHGWERGHADWRRTAIRNEGRNARGRVVRREERHGEHR